MSGAFEQAWLLLKSVFQPGEGELIGVGANQAVYGIEGDPDVTKVGHGMTLPDMYTTHLLANMPQFRNTIADQYPILQDEMLPEKISRNFEGRGMGSPNVLSTQERGEPLEEQVGRDVERGKLVAGTMYDQHRYGQLLEALGLADTGPRNWMRVKPQRGLPVSQITGKPTDEGHAVLHDGMFYGAENPKGVPQEVLQQFIDARGTPRRLGIDYQLPEEQREAFARKVYETPFQQFVQPYVQSVDEFHPKQLDALTTPGGHLDQQQMNINRLLVQMGLNPVGVAPPRT
tara:strand:+ start:3342 stop:4202 length:861 start_codon:yes stop_codon:yes gene_type:complete